MQEKFNDLKKYAQDKSKKIIAKIRDKHDDDANIESYDGDDAYYTGSDEDYAEFLKSVGGDMPEEEAVPVENTQRVSIGDTINLQGMIDKFREKAGEFTSAAKKIKEDISSQIEDFKTVSAEKAESEKVSDNKPEKCGEPEPEPKAVPAEEHKSEESDVKPIARNEFRNGMTAVAEGLSAVDKRIDALDGRIDSVDSALAEISGKLLQTELKISDSGKETERSVSDLKADISVVEGSVNEVKQTVSGITKLGDSIFDLKNSQVNMKNTLEELEMCFIKLKKKCIAGITILSILSAVIIGLQIVQLLS